MVRGKKFCIIKEGMFFIYEKSSSKKPTASFLLQGKATVHICYLGFCSRALIFSLLVKKHMGLKVLHFKAVDGQN